MPSSKESPLPGDHHQGSPMSPVIKSEFFLKTPSQTHPEIILGQFSGESSNLSS